MASMSPSRRRPAPRRPRWAPRRDQPRSARHAIGKSHASIRRPVDDHRRAGASPGSAACQGLEQEAGEAAEAAAVGQARAVIPDAHSICLSGLPRAGVLDCRLECDTSVDDPKCGCGSRSKCGLGRQFPRRQAGARADPTEWRRNRRGRVIGSPTIVMAGRSAVPSPMAWARRR